MGKRTSEQTMVQIFIALVILGLLSAILRMLLPLLLLVAIGAGAWWLWKQFYGKRSTRQHELKTAFYQLLQQNHGRITLMDFAYRTQLLGAEAKLYLDERAKEFNASFDVDSNGNVVYCFGLPAQFIEQKLQEES